MPLIAAYGISKSFVERRLFSDVSFEVAQGDRVGLVGVNGCGKTTLFRILVGAESVDDGSVYRNKEMIIGSMNQSISDDSMKLYDYVLSEFTNLIENEAEQERLLIELESSGSDAEKQRLILRLDKLRESYFASGGLTYRARVRSALLGLGFIEDEFEKRLSDFSGGQRNKAQLARVIMSDANMLLLDEPTNHLDVEATTWLEGFLVNYPHAFIVISHDRYFLDKVTNKTFELENQTLTQTKGNYTQHVEKKCSDREIAYRHYKNTQREIRRIEGIVEQQKRFGRERNFITAESKQKQIERLRATLVEPERDAKSVRFSFSIHDGCGNDVIIAENISKQYGGKVVFDTASLHIKKGERVFLLGANGCGKTTLLRILSKREHYDSGRINYGVRVVTGYYDQNVNANVGKGTLIDEVHDSFPLMNLGEIRSAMALFLFRGDDVYKESALASGGERARIQLLKLMLSGSNFLLLDEPTNHLDISSREALESALQDYEGTLLVVTHDRYLVNKLADRVLHMTKDGIREYIGGYDEFALAMANQQSSEKEQQVQQPKSQAALSYKAQKELRSTQNKLRGEITRTEARISAAEQELAKIQDTLSLEQTAFDYKETLRLSEEADALQKELEELYERWQEASVQLEQITEGQLTDAE